MARKPVANRLRVLRADKKLSQHDVALALECSQSRVSLIENGYEPPTDDDVKRLVKLFRVEASAIFPQLAA